MNLGVTATCEGGGFVRTQRTTPGSATAFCCQNVVIVHHLLKLKNFHNRTVLFFPSVRVTVTALETEQLRWKSYWQDLGTYPTLVILIVKILFATTFITTAIAKRSLKNLKFIKNTWGQWRRSGPTKDRLAHLLINKDIKLNYNKVIDHALWWWTTTGWTSPKLIVNCICNVEFDNLPCEACVCYS